MRPARRHRWLEVLLESLLPQGTAEAIVGDLEEELSERARSVSRREAAGWYRRQVARTIAALAFGSLRQRAPAMAGVAFAAYLGASLVELVVGAAASRFLPLGDVSELIVQCFVGLTALIAAGYFATRFCRGAAAVVGLIVVGVVSILVLTVPGSVPAWYAAVFLIVGPAAPIVGSLLFVLRIRKPRRS